MSYIQDSEFDESKLVFSSEKPGRDLLEAAEEVPEAMGSLLNEGIFLGGEVISLKLLDVESTVSLIGPISVDEAVTNPLVRVEYDMWILPKEFDVDDPECLTYRRERIYTRSNVILEGEVVTYGLGSEYNLIHWDECEVGDRTASDPSLPESHRCCLLDLLRTEWDHKIREWLDMDVANIPPGLSPDFLELYQSLIEADLEEERLDEEKRRNSPIWDLESAELWPFEGRLGVKIDSWDGRKALTAEVTLDTTTSEDFTDIEVSLCHRHGLMLVHEQRKQFSVPSKSESEWEDELLALARSGWIAQQFSDDRW